MISEASIQRYAIWHGQHAWVGALDAVNFGPAKGLLDKGEFWGAGTLLPQRMSMPQWAQRERLTRSTVAAARQRHLQPWQARNFKDLLRQADAHGPDHATPVGATPLMLAAAAGNAALVQALLDKGADPDVRDEFGHTAWDHALGRAMREAGFARSGLASLLDLLAPATIDVQTDERLVRLERHQGQYWVLTLMLAGLKTQWSRCVTRKVEPWKYARGFFAEQLHDALAELPLWLWPDARRKRVYINQVLARAEVASTYRPARKLWARAANGYYLPNPAMKLRVGDEWVAVYDALALDWIDRGCGGDDPDDDPYLRRPAYCVGRLGAPGPEATTDESSQDLGLRADEGQARSSPLRRIETASVTSPNPVRSTDPGSGTADGA